jgi:hypothetical protein
VNLARGDAADLTGLLDAGSGALHALVEDLGLDGIPLLGRRLGPGEELQVVHGLHHAGRVALRVHVDGLCPRSQPRAEGSKVPKTENNIYIHV